MVNDSHSVVQWGRIFWLKHSCRVSQQIARNRLQWVGRKSSHGCGLCFEWPPRKSDWDFTVIVKILRLTVKRFLGHERFTFMKEWTTLLRECVCLHACMCSHTPPFGFHQTAWRVWLDANVSFLGFLASITTNQINLCSINYSVWEAQEIPFPGEATSGDCQWIPKNQCTRHIGPHCLFLPT